MLKKYFITLLLLSSWNFSYGLENNWKAMDLNGGYVTMLAQDPVDSKLLLASGVNSIFRSTDSAATWVKVISGTPLGVVFSKKTAGLAYLPPARLLTYKTTDGGLTWSSYPASATADGHIVSRLDIRPGFSIDPTDDNLLYGADNDDYSTYDAAHPENFHPRAIYRSVDGGATWTAIKVLDNDNGKVSAIIAPEHNKICASLFSVNNSTGGIYCSSDTGTTWQLVASMGEGGVYALAANPYNPAELYAGAYHAVLVSMNSGKDWNSVAVSEQVIPTIDSGNKITVNSIAVTSTGMVVACNGYSCYMSNDYGSNWGPGTIIDPKWDTNNGAICGSVGSYQGSLLFSPKDISLYLADGNGTGIHKLTGSDPTSDPTFVSSNNGLNNMTFTGILHDPVNHNILYATSGLDFYVSTNTGASWMISYFDGKHAGSSGSRTYDGMQVAPDGTLYAGINKGLYVSTDSGVTWEKQHDFSSDPSISGMPNALAFDPTDTTNKTMYLGLDFGSIGGATAYPGLFKSVDSGVTWSRIKVNGADSSVTHIAVSSTVDTSVMYVASNPDFVSVPDNGYLYKTSNGGTSWTQINYPLNGSGGFGAEINSLALDPDHDGTLYMNNGYYLGRSTDAGATWTTLWDDHVNGSLGKFIITHPSGEARAMYLGKGDSVYMSINEGVTWTLIGKGFTGVWALAAGSLYVGSSEGLYKTNIAAKEISSTTATALNYAMPSGSIISANIPPGAFGAGVIVMLNISTVAVTETPQIKPTGLAVSVETNISTQPASDVTLTFHYADFDVSGFDETKLAVVRVNGPGDYTVLASTPTPSLKTVTAATAHFSNYALVQYGASSAPTTTSVPPPLAYPMPFNPRTQAAGMKIDNLAAGSEVKIYTIIGQLVRKIAVPVSGRAVWDGRNDAGKTVASGIYIALVRDQAQKIKRLKLAVEK